MAAIKEALQIAFNGNKPTDIELITRGGPENDITVDSYYSPLWESLPDNDGLLKQKKRHFCRF